MLQFDRFREAWTCPEGQTAHDANNSDCFWKYIHPDLCTRVSPVKDHVFFIITHMITKEFWLLLMPVAHLVLNHPTYLASISYILCRDTLLQFCVVAWWSCCDTPAEWKVGQVICKVIWLFRNQDVAIFSLHGVSKCHSYFSWLTQAIPLAVLQGVSAQWRLLQAQSKCSVIHSVLSSENRQKYLFTLATGWPSIHTNKLCLLV